MFGGSLETSQIHSIYNNQMMAEKNLKPCKAGDQFFAVPNVIQIWDQEKIDKRSTTKLEVFVNAMTPLKLFQAIILTSVFCRSLAIRLDTARNRPTKVCITIENIFR